VPTGPLVAGVIKEPLAHVLPGRPRTVQPRGIDLLDFDDAAAPWALPEYSNTRLTGRATKDYDRATDAHFRPDKPWGATGKSLIVLNPWLTLNHRVPGSSPGAPTTQSSKTRMLTSPSRKVAFAAISRALWSPISGLCAEIVSLGPF
jgi:hypothetical protein